MTQGIKTMNDKYKVISSNEISDLEKEVNEAIEKGWTPQGGIAINNESVVCGVVAVSGATYVQSMVKCIFIEAELEGNSND